MARYTIPDKETAEEVFELVVNATDRVRVSALALSAELAEDIARAEEDRLALIRFKGGDEAASAAKAQVKADAEAYGRQAAVLKAEAEAGAKLIKDLTEPDEPAKYEKPVTVEVAVGAPAAEKGDTVTLVQGGRVVARAEVDAKGVARFDTTNVELQPKRTRGFRMARLAPTAAADPVDLVAEYRTANGQVLIRKAVATDLTEDRIAVELVVERPKRGGKTGR